MLFLQNHTGSFKLLLVVTGFAPRMSRWYQVKLCPYPIRSGILWCHMWIYIKLRPYSAWSSRSCSKRYYKNDIMKKLFLLSVHDKIQIFCLSSCYWNIFCITNWNYWTAQLCDFVWLILIPYSYKHERSVLYIDCCVPAFVFKKVAVCVKWRNPCSKRCVRKSSPHFSVHTCIKRIILGIIKRFLHKMHISPGCLKRGVKDFISQHVFYIY